MRQVVSRDPPRSILEAVRCPHCRSALDVRTPDIECPGCGRRYPRLGSIPILLPDPAAYIASCHRQLDLLEQQSAQTAQVIQQQMETSDVVGVTRKRCKATVDAVLGQAADICTLLRPLLPGNPTSIDANDSGDEYPAPLRYIHYLYRDWGWPDEEGGENEQALSAMDAVMADQTLGRTLVVGAGACRLAYDLHRRDPDAETVVIDIDPLLFAVAHAVIRGGSVAIREANAEIDEIDRVQKQWRLAAPRGPINESRFHFMLANGLEAPFAELTFDTVVTPWFIDVVPSDLRDFISTIHRLLKPGGRWLNLGPLRYSAEMPASRRFAREEVFHLAGRAGFRVDKWQTTSMPYLVSKLNGRGKVEWTLAFSATKHDSKFITANERDEPPMWLLFRHLPVPRFAEQTVFWSKAPLVQMVISAIDGMRTLDDLTALVSADSRAAGLTTEQIREAVRLCLAEVHPECRK